MRKLTQKLKLEFFQNRNLVFVLFTFCMIATLSFFATASMHQSSAANPNNFRPGNIISDVVMANYSSMSEAEIQNFLSSKNSCDNRDYDLYLQYTSSRPSISWHWEGEPYNGHFVCLSEEKFGDGPDEIGTGKTAARIIYEAAQEFKINPQALLVLLQKESSLITDKVPNSYDYGQATGYGCPDTAACDKKYSGFKNQVHRAAELFRYVLDNNSRYYPAGSNVYIGYHPSSSCGGSQVYIENRATAALYQYTPYQPNSSALAAGYGQGNSCSAYGNRNFYLYFTDWFGSTQAAVDGEVTVIPDGIYNLSAKLDSTKVFDTSNSSELQLRSASNTSTRLQFRRDTTTGYYTIMDVDTNRYLSAASTTPENGTDIQLSRSSSGCASQWKVFMTPDKYLTLESTCSPGMVIDYNGGSTKEGTKIQLWTANQGNPQKWNIHTGQPLADGVYTISSSNSSEKNIDIAGGHGYNGNNIQLWDQNHADAQKWRLEYNASLDYYTFTNPKTGKRLDLYGANPTSGNNIQLWEPVTACSQRWKIIPVDDKHYSVLSTCMQNRAIDLSGGNTNNMTNIRIWNVDNTNAQKWTFQNQQLIADGNYVITSKVDQKYALDIHGGFNYDGTNVWLYSANGADAQLWNVHYNSQTGDYSLRNQTGDRSLDLTGCITSPGTNIELWSNNSTCAQRWTLIENADGTYTFISTCSHERAIDLVSSEAFDTNNARLWSHDDSNAQHWYFTKQ